MFRIDRPNILSELSSTLGEQSVVLTGPPGIGKSWILAQAADDFKARGYRVLVLAAESYDVANLQELTERLNLPSEIIGFLNSLGDRILLFIDGLDALRSEGSSRAFRALIEQTKQRAPNVRMLITIRTFDLEQSYVLRRILTYGQFTTINVGDLTDQELLSATEQAVELAPLLSAARPAMLKLLRNPFMLRLALSLIADGISYESLSAYSSEVQLLARFWHRRVEAAQDASRRRRLLSTTVRKMSDNKLLSASIVDLIDLGTGEASALKHLQSDELLRERNDRIMFDHNILFDYAASRLLLTLETLLPLMRDDASRSIFLRPSIAYFYTGLWLNDEDSFWRLFRTVSEPENGYQERLTVEPANVIAANLSDANELSILSRWPRASRNRATRAILRGVTNESFSTHSKRSAWSSAFEQILDDMQGDYVNELIRLLNQLAESSPRKEKPRAAALARQMLKWAWKEAESPESMCDPVALTSVVNGRLLPIVLGSYSASPEETRAIVQRLLKQFGSESSSPKDAMYVAWGLKNIVDADPSTAVDVVNAIFEYEETSSSVTQIGSGTIMPFTSNKRQDFEQARYVLQREYSYFVAHSPFKALTAALYAVEHEVRREHLSAWNREPRFFYSYRETEAAYRSDLSEIWDQGHRDELSLTLLDICLRAILGEGGNRTADPQAVIETIAATSELAVIWRHVFSPFLSSDQDVFKAILPLIEIPQFLAAPEVTRSIGSYIEKIYEKGALDAGDKIKVERSILALESIDSDTRYETIGQTRAQLFARIPVTQLVTPEATELRASIRDKEDTLNNEPYVRSSFGQLNVSNEEFLRMRGVDVDNPRSQALLRAIEPLRAFSSGYVNSIPTADQIAEVFADLNSAWLIWQAESDDSEIAQSAAGIIAACGAAIAKNDHLHEMDKISSLCRDILLTLSTHAQPEARPDDKFDHPGWGAPLTRIEVAEGVMSYGAQFPLDGEIIEVVQRLAADAVPAVRFQIAIRLGMFLKSRLDIFTKLMRTMIQNERTAGVLGGLTQTINRIAYADPDAATSLIRQVVESPNYPEIIEHFGQDFLLVTLLQLDLFKRNRDAEALLQQLLEAPRKNIGTMIRIAHHIRQIIEIKDIPRSDSDRALQWLYRLVLQANAALSSFSENTDTQMYFVNLLKCVDTVVFQLMILLDVDSNLRQDTSGLSDAERKSVYERVEQILIAVVLSRGPDSRFTPSTALNLLKIFTKCLAYSPRKILKMAVATVSAGARYGFTQDYMAISEFVGFAEVFLADHRDLLREDEAAKEFSDMLDIFVSVGWPQAVEMVMTLDEALR